MTSLDGTTHPIKKKDNRKELGRWGEEQAVHYLLECGFAVLERNWRDRSGEIDAIALDGDTLVFVEVRTRSQTGRFGTAEESVDTRKQLQVRDTAQLYLYRTKQFDRKCRFDVIAITGAPQTGSPDIRHIPNAF